MEEKLNIQRYCHIKDNVVSLNGKIVHQQKDTDFPIFIKSAYKALDTNYSKFFKMDNLSKLTFLAADVLLMEEGLEKESNIALVLSNKASSLDTDRKHHNSIADKENYYPSPAVFVYTLPNIGMGEISIKHKLYSENGFFIFDSFNAEHLHDYAESLMNTGQADKVLCGWVDFDDVKYDAFLYVVSKNGTFAHNKEEINRLYQIR